MNNGNGSCPRCKGAQWLRRDVPVGHPDFSRLFPCECIRPILEARHQQQLMGSVGLPPDQLEATFDNFYPDKAVPLAMPRPEDKSYEARRIRDRKRQLAQAGGGLVAQMRRAKSQCLEFARQPEAFLILLGESGSGKTHLAAAIANYRLSQGQQVCFAVVPDLLDHLRATFAPNSVISYDQRFEAYRNVSLLILDDLGAEQGTSWVQEKLYQLINHRYNWRLPTVVTTNDLQIDLDSRLRSRLFDQRRNTIFELLAGDYRSKSRPKDAT